MNTKSLEEQITNLVEYFEALPDLDIAGVKISKAVDRKKFVSNLLTLFSSELERVCKEIIMGDEKYTITASSFRGELGLTLGIRNELRGEQLDRLNQYLQRENQGDSK